MIDLQTLHSPVLVEEKMYSRPDRLALVNMSDLSQTHGLQQDAAHHDMDCSCLDSYLGLLEVGYATGTVIDGMVEEVVVDQHPLRALFTDELVFKELSIV